MDTDVHLPFLIAAYAVVWLGVLIYVTSLARRSREAERELDELSTCSTTRSTSGGAVAAASARHRCARVPSTEIRERARGGGRYGSPNARAITAATLGRCTAPESSKRRSSTTSSHSSMSNVSG